MEINEWVVKARLLDVGDTLHISCVSSSEAYAAQGKFQAALRGTGFGDYSLITYTKPQDSNAAAWWVCLAKVPRTDVGYVKKANGTMSAEGDNYIAKEAQRVFQLAIKDGRSDEEVLAMAISELEIKYIKELFKSTRGTVLYQGIR